MDIILIAGLWLPSTIWSEVGSELERLGHNPLPVALPGVDNEPWTATLADQVTAAIDVVDTAHHPLVVGHSAACTLAWMIADRRPDQIDSVVLIGGFPTSAGNTYADFFPIVDGAMAFPGWEPFEGPDAADLDDATRRTLSSLAVPVPGGVATGVVELADERRFDVPLMLVCPEYTTEQARNWVEGGDVPELANAHDLTYVDIDTGHWPMVTKPVELARILDAAATRS